MSFSLTYTTVSFSRAIQRSKDHPRLAISEPGPGVGAVREVAAKKRTATATRLGRRMLLEFSSSWYDNLTFGL
jgi:hypothetical protein